MQSNQYEYTEDFKYGDNKSNFIIIMMKKGKSIVFFLCISGEIS